MYFGSQNRFVDAWYFGALTRDDAMTLLSKPWAKDGDFVVRDSSQKNCYAVSFRKPGGEVSHRLISQIESTGQWTLGEKLLATSVAFNSGKHTIVDAVAPRVCE